MAVSWTGCAVMKRYFLRQHAQAKPTPTPIASEVKERSKKLRMIVTGVLLVNSNIIQEFTLVRRRVKKHGLEENDGNSIVNDALPEYQRKEFGLLIVLYNSQRGDGVRGTE